MTTEIHLSKKIALDVATFFRVYPWLLMGDNRDPKSLVRVALRDVQSLVDSAHQNSARAALLRGLVHQFMAVLGTSQSQLVEALLQEIMAQVDLEIDVIHDDGLDGEVA